MINGQKYSVTMYSLTLSLNGQYIVAKVQQRRTCRVSINDPHWSLTLDSNCETNLNHPSKDCALTRPVAGSQGPVRNAAWLLVTSSLPSRRGDWQRTGHQGTPHAFRAEAATTFQKPFCQQAHLRGKEGNV